MREIVEDARNRVMYYLKDGPEKAFVSEELMLIPEDTELSPDYVQEWQYLSQLDRYYRRTLFKAKVIPLVFPQNAW